MRRDTLIGAVNRVAHDLEISGVAAAFRDALSRGRPGKEEAAREWMSFAIFQNFSRASDKYTNNERTILSIMGLESLTRPEFWQDLSRDPDRATLFSFHQNISNAIEFLPRISSLLARNYPDPEIIADEHIENSDLRGKSLIRLILSEDEGQYSSTQRLIMSLESIQGIYDSLNEINNIEASSILVLGIDSGSDKLFDLLGLSSTVSDAKDLILGLFDRIVFHKQTVVSKNIASIAESLPVFERLAILEKESHLGPEQCELIRRQLLSSLGKFVESGTMIPEMTHSIVAEPRSIMRPQPKLLSAPVDISSGAAHANTAQSDARTGGTSDDQIPPEQAALIIDMLSKAGYLKADETTKTRPAQRSRKKP